MPVLRVRGKFFIMSDIYDYKMYTTAELLKRVADLEAKIPGISPANEHLIVKFFDLKQLYINELRERQEVSQLKATRPSDTSINLTDDPLSRSEDANNRLSKPKN